MRALLLATALASSTLAAPANAQSQPPATVDTALAAARALAPVPPGRLGDAAAPKAYRLDLTLDPTKDRFSGRSEIDVELKRASKFIDLHGRNLAITRAIARVGGKSLVGRWFEVDPSGVGRLVFDSELPAGPVTLAFEYTGEFNTSPAGLFRVNVGGDWYSWSQFQSTDARTAFPSFDEPGFKTPFTVTLRTPPGLTAISNAAETGKSTENGMDVHRYDPTLPLPTYLMAMMVGPFAVAEGTVPPTPQRAKPLPLRIVTTKQNAGQMTYAMEGSKDIVRLLEAYFNQGFPYPKLDQITSPIMPGAMENAGADLYADPILILDDQASTGQKRSFGAIVSHELAHQWFGDLVTPAWWDDIWLNESFANWMGYRIGHEWKPELNIAGDALAEGFNAMNTDALIAGRPIRQQINTTAQIDAAFDTITYGKGGHVVAMIAGYMGDDRFRDGVRRYMAAHTYGNATSDDFFAAMAEAAGDARIVPAMKSFVEQQGVPLVTFTPGKRGAWTATQSRYTRFGTPAPDTRWGIPLCVRPIGGKQTCQLLDAQTMSIAPGGKGPIVPNAGGTGYYRFELPAREWDRLIAKAATLPGGEALAVDDSLLASYRAGRSNAGQMIRLAFNLAKHPDSHASDAAIDSLRALVDSGLANETGQSGYQRLLRRIYAPQLARLGVDPRKGAFAKDAPERAQQRLDAAARMSSTVKDPVLRKRMSDAAAAWLAGDENALDPAWYGIALEAWQSQAGIAGSKQLIDRALGSEDVLFRPVALRTVASSGDLPTARWLLEDFTDPRLRPSERLDLIGGVVRNPKTRDYGFDWIKANFAELLNSNGGLFYNISLPYLVGSFCSVTKADEIANIFRPQMAGKAGAIELERTIERVRACGMLKDARTDEFSRALAKVR